MILLTVGGQLPFDRLVRIVDELAPDLNETIFGQIGSGGSHFPASFEYVASLAPVEFERVARQARVIVSHAGIGSILTARRLQKPIVLFPRRAELGEHRNDHQLATCAKFSGRHGIHVSYDQSQLSAVLMERDLAVQENESDSNSRQLLNALAGHFELLCKRHHRHRTMASSRPD